MLETLKYGFIFLGSLQIVFIIMFKIGFSILNKRIDNLENRE